MTARILMVDDEEDAQELFRQNFRREVRKGVYAFDYAQSAEAALDILAGQTPPEFVLVLSDINMPGKSGIDLLAEIREQWQDVSVFMITAYGDEGTQARTKALGAEEFLTKPIDFDALKGALARAVGQDP